MDEVCTTLEDPPKSEHTQAQTMATAATPKAETPRPRPRRRHARLSVICMTAGPGPRVAALLGLLRAAADEIVVAVDNRADPSVRTHVAAVADRVVLYPYADPVDRPLPWLVEQCRSDWALALDDDEVPGCRLVEALPALVADERVAHYSIPRRWIYPDVSTFLDEAPWTPDYQPRLIRTDGRHVRFSAELHRPIVVTGPGRFVDTPVWHLDPVLHTFEDRRAKARRYEDARPGLRVGARALNFAFYLPETRPAAPLGRVPADDRAAVEAVLAAGPPVGPPRAESASVTREAIDACWPASALEPQAGTLELLEQPRTLRAGEQRTVDVRVRNAGPATWPWGDDCEPRVRVGVRWFDHSGRELHAARLWTTLPAPIEPRESDLVPVHLRAPDAPGRYQARLGLLQEHVGWFGAVAECEITTLPRRRVAVAGTAETVARVSRVLESFPEVELLVLRRSPRTVVLDGYPEATDCRAYLFDGAPQARGLFAVVFLWRSLRLLTGSPRRARLFVETVRGCELVVAAGHDGPPLRRERAALALAAWKARLLGVRVCTASEPDALHLLLSDD